jgi:DNA-binding NarL/FixJ family response regulator
LCLSRTLNITPTIAPSPLSRLERDILTRCAEGWTLAQVAKEQHMSVRMVKYVVQRIKWRLGARNIPAAVAHAIRAGWI